MHPTLLRLALERKYLLRDLAPLLRKAGPNHPKRAQVNHTRTIQRKVVRAQLRANSEAICAAVLAELNAHDDRAFLERTVPEVLK